MQVLEVLAETPGEVVTRETLVARVWPGVFVSDDVLHRAIRELRRIFGDDTSNPTYVETIRKRGYRLIAPVRTGCNRNTRTCACAGSQRRAARAVFIAAASIALAAALGAVVYALASRPAETDPTPASVRFVALTSGPANETDPALSPDGARLAFAMRPDPADYREAAAADIYITEGAGRTPQRVIAHPADDRYPAWSLDASALAFIRIDGATCDVMLLHLRRSPRTPRRVLRQFRGAARQLVGRRRMARRIVRARSRSDSRLADRAHLDANRRARGTDAAQSGHARRSLAVGLSGRHAHRLRARHQRRHRRSSRHPVQRRPAGARHLGQPGPDRRRLERRRPRRSSTPPIAPAVTPIWRVPASTAATPRARGRRRREIEASVGGSHERPHRLRELVLRDQPVGSADRRASRSRRRSDADAPSGRAHVRSVEPLARALS